MTAGPKNMTRACRGAECYRCDGMLTLKGAAPKDYNPFRWWCICECHPEPSLALPHSREDKTALETFRRARKARRKALGGAA